MLALCKYMYIFIYIYLLISWLPGHKLSHLTAKPYTTRCFWKHLRREIGITVTEYWFIFDQRCLVWTFDRSSRVIDSSLRGGRLQLGSDWLFSSGLWNLADAIRSTGGHRRTQKTHDSFSDFLSHALLSGYSDRLIKTTFFNHICSNSTHCSFNCVYFVFQITFIHTPAK